MEGRAVADKGASNKTQATLVRSCIGQADVIFRILLVAPDDVVSALVKAIDKHILHKHAFLKVVIHTAISLNEDIARKLNESGIHAVILCVDASRNMTMGSINETIKHLDRDLIYRSMVIVNIMKPFTITYHSISERVTHLVRVFKCQIVHMLMEDEKSVDLGVVRAMTALLRGSGFQQGFTMPLAVMPYEV